MSASAAAAPKPLAIHASAVVVAESAVLLRGPSGAGKSALALALIQAAATRGLFARLIADDRTVLRHAGGRLVVASHPAIAGRVERRFVGLCAVAHEDEAVARLVVDLAMPDAEASTVTRLPSRDDRLAMLAGVRLPHLTLPTGFAGATEAILHRLGELQLGEFGPNTLTR